MRVGTSRLKSTQLQVGPSILSNAPLLSVHVLQRRDRSALRVAPREQLLWSGRPDARALFIPADGFLIPFGLLFLGFAVFWTTEAAEGAPAFFPIFGFVFIVFGLSRVRPILVKVWRKRRSIYAVTDRRAFAVEGGTVTDTPIIGVGRTVSRSRRNRLVSVVFTTGRAATWNPISGGNRMPPNSGLDGFMYRGPLAFFDVPDGDGLLRALVEAESLQLRSR